MYLGYGMTKKIDVYCAECGARDVKVEGFGYWSIEDQMLKVESFDCKIGWCDECRDEVGIKIVDTDL